MTEATNEYVIMGNSALMRCVIPSFVSDFISLQSWQDEKGNVIVAHNNNHGRQQHWKIKYCIVRNFDSTWSDRFIVHI